MNTTKQLNAALNRKASLLTVLFFLILANLSHSFSQNVVTAPRYNAYIDNNIGCPNYKVAVSFLLKEIIVTPNGGGWNYNLNFDYEFKLTENVVTSNNCVPNPALSSIQTYNFQIVFYDKYGNPSGIYYLSSNISTIEQKKNVTTTSNQSINYSTTNITPTLESLGIVKAKLLFEAPNFTQQTIILSGGSGPSVLPVALLDFTAKNKATNVNLDWSTGSERNSSHYEIYKSTDLQNFEPIGRVASVGNTTQESNYEFIDTNPSEGISYYKLVQVDFDGQTEELKLISNHFQAPTLIAIYNEMGQIVSDDYQGLMIKHYSDGTITKIFTLK